MGSLQRGSRAGGVPCRWDLVQGGSHAGWSPVQVGSHVGGPCRGSTQGGSPVAGGVHAGGVPCRVGPRVGGVPAGWSAGWVHAGGLPTGRLVPGGAALRPGVSLQAGLQAGGGGGLGQLSPKSQGAGDPAPETPARPPSSTSGAGCLLLHSREAGEAPWLRARLPWQEAWAPSRTDSGARLWANSRGWPLLLSCSPAPTAGAQCCPHSPGPPSRAHAFSGAAGRGMPLCSSRALRPAWAFCRCPLQQVGKGPVSPPGEALTIPETGATPGPWALTRELREL